jgi:hypothetical protein
MTLVKQKSSTGFKLSASRPLLANHARRIVNQNAAQVGPNTTSLKIIPPN